MIDAESLLYQLMLSGKPNGVTLSADIDVDSIDTFPFVTYSVAGNGQVSNSDGLWDVVLNLNAFGEGRSSAHETISSLYDLVHTWAGEAGFALAATYGWVNDVGDLSLPDRLASTDINGRNVTQYAASFALQVRK